VFTELGALAAEAMGERFLTTPARDNRARQAGSGTTDVQPRTRRGL
jgi:hypothetical protein